MSRTVLFIVCVAGILIALGLDAIWLTSLATLTLLLLIGFYLIFRGKLPRDAVPMLIALIIGPCFVAVILRALLTELTANWPGILSGVPLLLVMIFLMTVSFLYVRGKIVRFRKAKALQGHTNERQMILPASYDERFEAGIEVERDQFSSKVVAQED